MRSATLAAAAILAVATGASAGQLSVGSGASVDLGAGSLALGCANLSVAGTMAAGTVGFDQARDVTIDPSGVLNGESATLQVAGDWDNAGTFNALARAPSSSWTAAAWRVPSSPETRRSRTWR